VGLNFGLFNFSFANASSLPQAPEDLNNAMSVRWTGSITAPATGDYTFSLTHLGTARLFLDGRLLIDDPSLALETQSVTLHAGPECHVAAVLLLERQDQRLGGSKRRLPGLCGRLLA
jgi:beta-glucosidase